MVPYHLGRASRVNGRSSVVKEPCSNGGRSKTTYCIGYRLGVLAQFKMLILTLKALNHFASFRHYLAGPLRSSTEGLLQLPPLSKVWEKATRMPACSGWHQLCGIPHPAKGPFCSLSFSQLFRCMLRPLFLSRKAFNVYHQLRERTTIVAAWLMPSSIYETLQRRYLSDAVCTCERPCCLYSAVLLTVFLLTILLL